VSADTLSSIDVTTDSSLDATSITNANVTLSAGTTSVAGVASAVGTKGFKFVPTSKLGYGQAYSFSATVKDTLGKPLTVTSTFTTMVVTCVAPAMANSLGVCMSPPAASGYTWNNVLRAWVADIGTLMVGTNQLPAACVLVGDACWNQSIANGTIKLVNTGMTLTGVNTRPMLFAYYQAGAGSAFPGYYMTTPIYADAVGATPLLPNNTGNGGNSDPFLNVKGSLSGLKETSGNSTCWEKVFANPFFQTNQATCPI
jgi:hypothetical protein